MKEKVQLKDILPWTDCKLISGIEEKCIYNISTDSRTIKKGDFFIPLTGENYDGHDFIELALKGGASGFVFESRHIEKLKLWRESIKTNNLGDVVILESLNNLIFLQNIAYNYIRKFNPTTIGITGSVGKTTTKDFLVSILSKEYKVTFTPKNYNTEIGVSKSILEIALGQSHMAFFKDLSEVAEAKAEIAEILRKNNGVLFLNNDNDYINLIEKKANCKIVKFGRNNNLPVNFIEEDMDEMGRFAFSLFNDNKKITGIKLSIPGYHNIYNACCAAAICLYLGISSKTIKKGIEDAVIPGSRMRIVKKVDKIIIDDCYNANPLSVKRAIDTLVLISEKRGMRSVAILGDMLELGKNSSRLHKEIGRYLSEKKISMLIAIGDFAKNIYDGYRSGSNFNKYKSQSYYFKNKEELSGKIDDLLKAGDLILVKGSRAKKMEDIINLI